MKRVLATALLLTASAAQARPIFMQGGHPVPGGGGGGSPTFDCGTGSVCVTFQNGQAFITWDDVDTGAAGANYRYRVYRSTSAIDAGNYTSATLIASYVLNNSGQLFGGNPFGGSVDPFTQPYRQSSGNPMVVLTDLGTALPYGTGLQAYTATGNGNAYYAVVSTNTSDGSPSYIGSVGPISETVATPQAIKWADSLDRGQTYGKFTGATNLPLVVKAHASSASSGCATVNCTWGDYWETWLPPEGGWQDGRQTAFGASEDAAQNIPSISRSIVLTPRDTIVDSRGLIGMETYHIGMGLTPNPLVGPANRYYLTSCQQDKQIINFALSHYNADPNAIHWTGTSLGAWGGASCGIRGMDLIGGPHISSLWLAFPVWRHDQRGSVNWPGKTWASGAPFAATTAAAPTTLGSTASSVLMFDGSTWGGTGGYADIPSSIASDPGTDIPFTVWSIGKYDPYPTAGGVISFTQQLDAAAAFETARRGYAFCWSTMEHDAALTQVPINRDGGSTETTIAYRKDKFRLDLAYIAFSNSSINDDPGDGTRGTNGLYTGDWLGCLNAGFVQNVTADTASAFDFTVSNPWMARSPTTIPQTTTVGTLTSSSTGTLALTSTVGWLSAGSHPYVLIGDAASPSTQELVKTSAAGSNSITITSSGRGYFGTTAQAHGAGVEVRQIVSQPTGPNGGPYATMTVDMAFRRMQGGLVPTSCTVTPFGDSPAAGSLSFLDGIPVLTGVTINSGGATSVACS
jgi:hypothetical protein